MKLPKLKDYFPATNALAELYGGWLEGPYFKLAFKKGTREEKITTAIDFLSKNGFDLDISIDDFNSESSYEVNSLSLDFNTMGGNILLLIYEQPVMSNPLDSVFKLVDIFREERDWKQFHDSKNLAMALSAESGELLDLFLWDRDKNVDIEKASNEIADVFVYLLLLSKELGVDLLETVVNKISQNHHKYPVAKSKGIANKYSDL